MHLYLILLNITKSMSTSKNLLKLSFTLWFDEILTYTEYMFVYLPSLRWMKKKVNVKKKTHTFYLNPSLSVSSELNEN